MKYIDTFTCYFTTDSNNETKAYVEQMCTLNLMPDKS